MEERYFVDMRANLKAIATCAGNTDTRPQTVEISKMNHAKREWKRREVHAESVANLGTGHGLAKRRGARFARNGVDTVQKTAGTRNRAHQHLMTTEVLGDTEEEVDTVVVEGDMETENKTDRESGKSRGRRQSPNPAMTN